MRIDRILTGLVAGSLFTLGGLTAQAQNQVSVTVKVIEFQTGTETSTGLSAYFRKVARTSPYGLSVMPNGAISVADLTFPSTTAAAITVFLDRLSSEYGEFELMLQALEDQNRAFILSRPRVMVPVGEATPTVIETVQRIPYEDTKVFGATARQITSFRDAGVYLSVQCPEVLDDDGDPRTTHDSFIRLQLTARVNEEGQRITVALDDVLAESSNIFNPDANEINVPEFVSREIITNVWVPHGQVLILGGLFRNTNTRSGVGPPWVSQTEDLINGTLQRVLPFNTPNIPVGAGLGSRTESKGRRELVFLVRAEMWKPSFTVADEFGFMEEGDEEEAPPKKVTPGDVISDVLEGISEIPRGVAEGLSGEPSGVGRQLGEEP